ncbi:MAG: hypothetical protein LBR80_16475 [Deltaproteobacteria bacterium]|nr:hypothetical protein [Deltaproteobacteria bacterium]
MPEEATHPKQPPSAAQRTSALLSAAQDDTAQDDTALEDAAWLGAGDRCPATNQPYPDISP